MRRLVVLAIAVISISGCALDRTGIGGPRRDAGPIDAASLDAGSFDGGARDAGIDSGIDAGIDSGVDSGVDSGIDSGIDSGPPPPRPCADIYGGVAGVLVCAERETECELHVVLSGSSCTAACASAGGACVTSYPDGDDAHPCDRIGVAESCDGTRTDQLCVCARTP